jgi:hypothetical protein
MRLRRNSNSRFAISRPTDSGQGFWRPEAGQWKLDPLGEGVESAEMGMVGDGEGWVELSLIRTTYVTMLVTICQERMGGIVKAL